MQAVRTGVVGEADVQQSGPDYLPMVAPEPVVLDGDGCVVAWTELDAYRVLYRSTESKLRSTDLEIHVSRGPT